MLRHVFLPRGRTFSSESVSLSVLSSTRKLGQFQDMLTIPSDSCSRTWASIRPWQSITITWPSAVPNKTWAGDAHCTKKNLGHSRLTEIGYTTSLERHWKIDNSKEASVRPPVDRQASRCRRWFDSPGWSQRTSVSVRWRSRPGRNRPGRRWVPGCRHVTKWSHSPEGRGRLSLARWTLFCDLDDSGSNNATCESFFCHKCHLPFSQQNVKHLVATELCHTVNIQRNVWASN